MALGDLVCLAREDRFGSARREPLGSGVHGVAPFGYEALRLSGEGTFAEVWKIRDLLTGRPFALKRLRTEWQKEPISRQLLSNEAQVAAAVRSRHVVRVVQSDSDCARPYCISEWIEGTSLERRLGHRGRLPTGLAVWVARQSAQGLADLAQAGFSHGDVKPANILLNVRGEVKLIDLGFARSIQHPECSRRNGLLAGTAEYMAPETLSRGHFGPVAKDMYSLGVTLFRMLTGRLPFEGETTADVLRLQRASKPPRLRRLCPAAPRELVDLVNRLLAKQPIRRPESLGVLVRQLIELELVTMPERIDVRKPICNQLPA